MKRKLVLSSLLLLGLFGVGMWFLFGHTPITAVPQIGANVTDFTLPGLEDGKAVSLKGTIASHKVTLLNFWATWCPPCRAEIPELIKFQSKYAASGVTFIGVNLREDPAEVRQFVKQNGMNFPIVVDPGKVADTYLVQSIPTTFIIDHFGKIRDKIVGGTTFQTLDAKVQRLLKEK